MKLLGLTTYLACAAALALCACSSDDTPSLEGAPDAAGSNADATVVSADMELNADSGSPTPPDAAVTEHPDGASESTNVPHLDASTEIGGDAAVHEEPPMPPADASMEPTYESQVDAGGDAAGAPTCAECRAANCLAERDACATDECQPLIECYETTGCAHVPGTAGDSSGCFCGELDPLDCFSAGDEVAGDCVEPVYAAMGDDAPSSGDVLLRWTNSDYA